jgi:hypothetical protein
MPDPDTRWLISAIIGALAIIVGGPRLLLARTR